MAKPIRPDDAEAPPDPLAPFRRLILLNVLSVAVNAGAALLHLWLALRLVR